MGKRAKRSKSKRKWLKIVLSVIALIIIGVGIYGFTIYNNAKKTVNDQMHEPVASIDKDVTSKKLSSQEPLKILVMGIDERENDKGRSDAMMVLTLDPDHEKMQMVTIPRDTRTEIVGHGTDDKINHAYAFGGSDMAVATVENLLDLELDYYIRINMEGLVELVDDLGGITVDNDFEFSHGKFSYPLGEQLLDGRETLGFVRMRKDDPQGDAGRTRRQRMVIEGIVDKGANIGSFSKVNGFINILGNNMATNMDFDDMKNIFKNYRNARGDFKEYAMEGEGTRIDGIYYLLVPDEEIEKAHHIIEDLEYDY